MRIVLRHFRDVAYWSVRFVVSIERFLLLLCLENEAFIAKKKEEIDEHEVGVRACCPLRPFREGSARGIVLPGFIQRGDALAMGEMEVFFDLPC